MSLLAALNPLPPGVKWRTWLAALPAAFLLAATSLPAQTAPSKEYQVKAVFLFNFAQFVEWPAAAFADPQAPVVLGILGENPFGTFLEETVRGEKVNGHPLVVEHYKQLGDIKTCHILFINHPEASRTETVLAGLKGRNILTVGDGDNFATQGGVIQFRTENNKIRLRINTTAAKAASVTISSKLLNLAELVTNAEK